MNDSLIFLCSVILSILFILFFTMTFYEFKKMGETTFRDEKENKRTGRVK